MKSGIKKKKPIYWEIEDADENDLADSMSGSVKKLEENKDDTQTTKDRYPEAEKVTIHSHLILDAKKDELTKSISESTRIPDNNKNDTKITKDESVETEKDVRGNMSDLGDKVSEFLHTINDENENDLVDSISGSVKKQEDIKNDTQNRYLEREESINESIGDSEEQVLGLSYTIEDADENDLTDNISVLYKDDEFDTKIVEDKYLEKVESTSDSISDPGDLVPGLSYTIEDADERDLTDTILEPAKKEEDNACDTKTVKDKYSDSVSSFVKEVGTFKNSIISLIIIISLFIMYDIYMFLDNVYEKNIIFGMVATLLMFGAFFTIYQFSKKQFKTLSDFQSINSLQKELDRNGSKKDDSVRKVLYSLLPKYASDDSKKEELEKIISNDYSTTTQRIGNFESKVFKSLDKKAEDKIIENAKSAAISTTISPYAFLDMILMLRTNFLLTKEILEIYKFKPTKLLSLKIMKEALFSILFAGGLEQADELVDNTVLSVFGKLSAGMFNGYRVIKLGLKIQSMVRPIPFQGNNEKSSDFLLKKLKERIFGKNVDIDHEEKKNGN